MYEDLDYLERMRASQRSGVAGRLVALIGLGVVNLLMGFCFLALLIMAINYGTGDSRAPLLGMGFFGVCFAVGGLFWLMLYRSIKLHRWRLVETKASIESIREKKVAQGGAVSLAVDASRSQGGLTQSVEAGGLSDASPVKEDATVFDFEQASITHSDEVVVEEQS